MARIVAVLVLVVAVAGWVPKPAAAQDVKCADYDAWEWAQLVLAGRTSDHVCRFRCVVTGADGGTHAAEDELSRCRRPCGDNHRRMPAKTFKA